MIFIQISLILLVMILNAGKKFPAHVIIDGNDLRIGNLYMLLDVKTNSICSDNFRGDEVRYCEFQVPYSVLPQIIKPDDLYSSQMMFGLYRWDILAPVQFEKDPKTAIQTPVVRGSRDLSIQDDITSVAFWDQTEPHVKFP